MNTLLNESSPLAQIARFDDWSKIPDFEMAYEPGPNDYLYWSLGPNYKPGPFNVPFSNATTGNGIDGRLYGNNTIPILDTMYCTPYVNACSRPRPVRTRAPDQGNYAGWRICQKLK
jgi:hypothetical protein